MPRRHTDPGTRTLRAALRSRIGLLKLNRIAAKTQLRYRRALAAFQHFCVAYGLEHIDDVEQLDVHVQEYIEALWHEGSSRGDAGATLSALQWALQRKRILAGGWQLFDNWGLLELPRRAPPLPSLILSGLVGLALTHGHLGIAAVLMSGFDGFLRTSEFLTLSPEMVSFSDSGALLVLPLTKSGQRRGGAESVRITDPAAVQLLWIACSRAACRSDPIVATGAPAFRRWFRWGLETLGVAHVGFLPYSVRRGGATHRFQQDPNVPNILLIGRWNDSRTARIYITEGALFLTKLALPTQAEASARHFANFVVHWLALAASPQA